MRKNWVMQVYRTLYELVVEGPARLVATDVHQFLASDPSVVCKGCYSALSKYGAIKETSSRISSRIATALPSETSSQVLFALGFSYCIIIAGNFTTGWRKTESRGTRGRHDANGNCKCEYTQ